MIHNLVKLLHLLEGELEEGDDVSQLHGGVELPLPLDEKVCLYQRLGVPLQQRTQHRKWSINSEEEESWDRGATTHDGDGLL